MIKIDVNKIDYKKIVKDGYEKCAHDYSKAREKDTEPSLEVINNLEPGSKILDIGCGSGVPVDLILSKRFCVTGIDISKTQIELAKANVVNADFVCADIMKYEFEKDYWDSVVSFYTIFHLSKEDQLTLFKRVYTSLKKGGYILFTLAKENEDAYIEDDFFNTKMFWSNFSFEEYQIILENIGFDIINTGSLNHGYNKDYDGSSEQHSILFAIKE